MLKRNLFLSLAILFVLCCDSSVVESENIGATIIHYSISQSGHVELYIDNSYNTRALTLINKNQPAGYYRVQIPDGVLKAGVYFWTLKLSGQVLGRRNMIVIGE